MQLINKFLLCIYITVQNISPSSVLLSLGSVVSTFPEMYTFVFNYVKILVQLFY